jgi:hypothetical protein
VAPTSHGEPIPNDLSLVNGTIGLQAFDATAMVLSTNFAELSFSLGIGTITVAEGPSSVATDGFARHQDDRQCDGGAPVSQGLGNVAIQGITHYGCRATVCWSRPRARPRTEQADIDIEKLTSVCQDGREPTTVHMSLPNGFDLYVCRDAANQRSFFLASLHRASGIVTRLTRACDRDRPRNRQPDADQHVPAAVRVQPGRHTPRSASCTTRPTPRWGNVGPPDRVLLVQDQPGHHVLERLQRVRPRRRRRPRSPAHELQRLDPHRRQRLRPGGRRGAQRRERRSRAVGWADRRLRGVDAEFRCPTPGPDSGSTGPTRSGVTTPRATWTCSSNGGNSGLSTDNMAT